MSSLDFPDSGRTALAALEALPMHVCVVDADGRVVAANNAWRSYARENCTRPELIAPGASYEEILAAMAGPPPDNLDTFLFALRELLAGRRDSATIEHRRDTGLAPFHFRTRVQPVVVDGQRLAMITHEDMSGLTAAASALSHSRIEFEALVNSVDGVIWEADPRTTNFTFVSDAAEALLGYPRESWYTHGFWASHIHPPDRDQAVRLCAEATARLENHALEYRLVARDGRLVWVREIVTVVAREGRPVVLRGVMFDITERVTALEELHRFRAALDTSADAILLVDRASMRVVDANETALALGGISRESLGALQVERLFVNIERALLERRFDEILESGERGVMQSAVRRADGRTFPAELRLSTLHGERPLVVVSLRDMSDRLSVEESHRERERLFAALFENNNAIKLILDPVTGRIVDANPAAVDFYGYSRDKLLRMSIHDLNPAPVAEVRAAMESAKSRKESRFEFAHRLANGDLRDVEIYSSPVALAGKRLLFSIIHDISERKRAEADAKRQRELLEGQNGVLQLIARDATLAESLGALVSVVERHSPGALCSVLLLDSDGATLRHGAAPSLPEEFNRLIDGQTIGPVGGSCGTAVWRREMVVVEDIATDPLWAPYRELAAPFGLAASWSNPILSNSGTVLGTFAIYYRERRRPSPSELHVIDVATSLACIAIERRAAVGALRSAEEHIRQVFAASPLPTFELDLEGHFRMWNAAAERVFGWTEDDVRDAPKRVVDASNVGMFAELRERVLRGELIIGAKVMRRRRDGREVPMTLHIAPLVDAAGKVSGLIAVTDVAEGDLDGSHG